MARTGVIRCLVAAVLFGASAPAASVLAQDMSALSLAGLLYLGAAVAVAPSVARRPPRTEAVRAGWKPVAVAVIAGGAVGPALLVAGLARIDAATASILLNLELVATVVLAKGAVAGSVNFALGLTVAARVDATLTLDQVAAALGPRRIG